MTTHTKELDYEDIASLDLEDQLDVLLKQGDAEDAESESYRKPKCPYLSTIGLTTIDCCAPNARLLKTIEFDSERACKDKANGHCFDRFLDCEDYKKYYSDPTTWDDWAVPEYRTDFRRCEYCCNSSGYTGLPKYLDGNVWCFCQQRKEPVERDWVCNDWFNRHPDWPLENKATETAESVNDFIPEVIKPAEAEVERAPVFDYSILSQETADKLRRHAENITSHRIKAVYEIGRELAEAHDELAANQIFGAWCKSIGISRDTAENYMRAYRFVAENFGSLEQGKDIQPSLLFAVSKPSAPPELQQAVVAGDITKHKDYLEALKKIKQAEEDADYWKSRFNNADAARTARERERDHEADKAKNNMQKILELEQQIDQLKRNLDPVKLEELGGIIREKQDLINELKAKVAELNKQLNAKPIEVPAMEVREVIPASIRNTWCGTITDAITTLAGLYTDDIGTLLDTTKEMLPEYFEKGFQNEILTAIDYLATLERELRTRMEEEPTDEDCRTSDSKCYSISG